MTETGTTTRSVGMYIFIPSQGSFSNHLAVTNSAGSPVSTFTTATNTAKGVTQTTNAASHINIGASAAGLLGLVVAAFAL